MFSIVQENKTSHRKLGISVSIKPDKLGRRLLRRGLPYRGVHFSQRGIRDDGFFPRRADVVPVAPDQVPDGGDDDKAEEDNGSVVHGLERDFLE